MSKGVRICTIKVSGNIYNIILSCKFLDLIDELEEACDEYDTDAVIIYKDGVDIASLFALAESLRGEGKRVTVRKTMPKRLKYKELIEFN